MKNLTKLLLNSHPINLKSTQKITLNQHKNFKKPKNNFKIK